MICSRAQARACDPTIVKIIAISTIIKIISVAKSINAY